MRWPSPSRRRAGPGASCGASRSGSPRRSSSSGRRPRSRSSPCAWCRAIRRWRSSGGPGANPTPEAIAQVTEQYGLDEPLVVQYATYLGNLATGDLGQSPALKRSVVDAITAAIGPTMQLIVSILVLAWLIALMTVSDRRRRTQSRPSAPGWRPSSPLPQFWLGLMLLVLFAFDLAWFPVSGGSGLGALVLPALALAIPLAGFIGQVTRDVFERRWGSRSSLSARARGPERPRRPPAPRPAARAPARPDALRLGGRRADQRRGGRRDDLRPARPRPHAAARRDGPGPAH